MLTINLFNGLVYGALLIVMSSGLALIYGLRRVVNFAHGALYMLGAFFAASFARLTRIVFAAADPKGGAVLHGPRFFAQPTCHWRPEWRQDALHEAEAAERRMMAQAASRPPEHARAHAHDRNQDREF